MTPDDQAALLRRAEIIRNVFDKSLTLDAQPMDRLAAAVMMICVEMHDIAEDARKENAT